MKATANQKQRTTFSRNPLERAIRDSLGAVNSYRAACGLLGVGLLGLAASGAVQAEFPATIGLSNLDGSNGFAINGVNSYDFSGSSVSDAGDFNGDGFGDLIIGGDPARGGSNNSYVVFGGPNAGRGGVVELYNLDGTNGFAVAGVAGELYSSRPVSGAGDVNGDNFDDLIIGNTSANGYAGQSYVVFGGQGVGSGGVLDLSTLDGSNGFTINGVNSIDFSGAAVSGAGDVNGDGFDDLFIGAPLASPNSKSFAGVSYLIFGGPRVGRSGVIELSRLDGTNGFAVNGINPNDRSGGSVSGAGDLNGDGVDDLIIGASHADPNGDGSGQSYLVFGGPGLGTGGVLELSKLDGTNGFAVNGVNAGDASGSSVSSAGDVNGDHVDDLIIGAPGAGPNGVGSGQSYVVLGRPGVAGSSVLELSKLDGSNGFVLNGAGPYGSSGTSVSGAGDVNGDGIADLIVGAPGGTWDYYDYHEISHGEVVFGGKDVGGSGVLELSQLDGGNGFALVSDPLDRAGSSVSNVGDFNGDGVDDVIIGAPLAYGGNGTWSGQSYLVFGRPSFAALRAVGDTNRDGAPEIAVVARSDGKTIAKVKDAASGTLISRFAFSPDLVPVDVEVMDGSRLVLLGQGSATGPGAETRDLLSGDRVSRVAFDPALAPVDLTVLPDQNDSGIPELGVLGRGSTRVEILDALTGDPVSNLWFAPRFAPHQVITLPDLNRNGSAEVGVVLAKADETDRLVIKDTRTSANVSTLGTWWQPQLDLLQALPVTNASGNPTANVAMLLRDPATGKVLVRVANARSNVTAATVRGYNPSFAPAKLAKLSDLNDNGLDDYALLARKPGTGELTAEVRDGAGGVSRMWFSSECTPLDFATIPDINANGAEELVMLGRCDGTLKAIVKDAKTGVTLRQTPF